MAKINGDMMRQTRENSGLTLKQTAQRLKVSEATLSRYECGLIARPDPDVMLGYSKIFRVPVTVFYEGSDPDWVTALQEGGLRDPRVAGYIDYLKEQAQKSTSAFQISESEADLIAAYRNADEKTRLIVDFALGLKGE